MYTDLFSMFLHFLYQTKMFDTNCMKTKHTTKSTILTHNFASPVAHQTTPPTPQRANYAKRDFRSCALCMVPIERSNIKAINQVPLGQCSNCVPSISNHFWFVLFLGEIFLGEGNVFLLQLHSNKLFKGMHVFLCKFKESLEFA